MVLYCTKYYLVVFSQQHIHGTTLLILDIKKIIYDKIVVSLELILLTLRQNGSETLFVTSAQIITITSEKNSFLKIIKIIKSTPVSAQSFDLTLLIDIFVLNFFARLPIYFICTIRGLSKKIMDTCNFIQSNGAVIRKVLICLNVYVQNSEQCTFLYWIYHCIYIAYTVGIAQSDVKL